MMNTEDLSFVADALLAIVGADADAPFSFDMVPPKPKSPPRAPSRFVELAAERRADDLLLIEECAEIYREARLTDNQAEVLDLRLGGMSFEQIARRRGRTRQGAMKVFLSAIKKIGKVMRVYPYTGLSDVYRQEVRRGLP